MKYTGLLLGFLALPLSGYATSFQEVYLSEDATSLVVRRSNGTTFNAPKLEQQDSFQAPQVSRRGEYAGWLAAYPNMGASYSLPINLVLVDRSNRLHRFSGNFGMVFGWCFSPSQESVVYRFSFPHGQTPTGFEMRRISDGRLLRQYSIPWNVGHLDRVPKWAKCAQASSEQ